MDPLYTGLSGPGLAPGAGGIEAGAGAATSVDPRRCPARCGPAPSGAPRGAGRPSAGRGREDRKSTRLNSSHVRISYAVFCLKKKKKKVPELACLTTMTV